MARIIKKRRQRFSDARSVVPMPASARYARVATGMIASIESPLDLLSEPRRKPRKSEKDQPSA